MNRVVLVLALVLGCGDDAPSYDLDREALLDPDSCVDCHPSHVEEWRGSMHAYAGDDPLFVAMNARGQRETGGELGDFCVKCHAPMAVREGLTTDGTNLADLPAKYRGVTCFFCHSVDAVEDDHNNPLRLADDLVMRGGFGDPVENTAHAATYSPLHDRINDASSSLCGSCHDIVTPAGVHLERTYLEYQDSVFPHIEAAPVSCGDCHMPSFGYGTVADYDGVPLRSPHDHGFPGLDTAIIDWPGVDDQRAAIERELDALLFPRVCHSPAGNEIQVRLTNIGAGHMFPSGAAQDRRMWVEVQAFAGDTLLYASGVVPEGTSPTELVASDPDLWLLRDTTFDENGDETHMFWDVAEIESELLPPATTLDPGDPAYDHSVLHVYPMGAVGSPDRIELAVRIQSVGLDVIDDLIASGDLDEGYRDALPVLSPSSGKMTWTLDAAGTDRCLP